MTMFFSCTPHLEKCNNFLKQNSKDQYSSVTDPLPTWLHDTSTGDAYVSCDLYLGAEPELIASGASPGMPLKFT